jgi:hypothetical protein
LARIVTLGLVLQACSTVGEVIPTGPDTYTVSSRMGGQLPAWSEVKALGLKRANEFCDAQKKQMTVVSWETHGARGWTPLDAELTFKCMDRATASK